MTKKFYLVLFTKTRKRLDKIMEKRVINYIFEKKSFSQLDIAKGLNLPVSRANRLIKKFLSKGIIIENGLRPSTGGRPPLEYAINPAIGLTASVIIDFDAIVISINDFQSNILLSKRIPTDLERNSTTLISKISQSIKELIKKEGVSLKNLKGIGIASGGIINREKGILRLEMINKSLDFFTNLKLGHLQLPIVLEDIVYVEALGEKNLGLAKKIQNFVYVRYKNTIGAAICINGKVHHDSTGYVSELGHITVDKEGPLCYCGSRGCLEQVASERYLEVEIKEAIDKGVNTYIKSLLDKNNKNKNILEIVSEACQKGDSMALSLLDRVAENFGIGLATMINLFHPQLIIIGGNIPTQETYIRLLKHYVKMYTLTGLKENIQYRFHRDIQTSGLKGLSEAVIQHILPSLI